jgi:hypothetical protein
MTVFVALLAYDTVRMEQYRVDCAPCVQLPPRGARLLLMAQAVAPSDVSDVLAYAVGNPQQVEGVLRHRSLQHVLQVGAGRAGGCRSVAAGMLLLGSPCQCGVMPTHTCDANPHM